MVISVARAASTAPVTLPVDADRAVCLNRTWIVDDSGLFAPRAQQGESAARLRAAPARARRGRLSIKKTPMIDTPSIHCLELRFHMRDIQRSRPLNFI